jgi:hypothetical protein
MEEGLSPLEYLLKVMRDPSTSDVRRDDAAKAAAPYLHAKRAPEDRQGKTVPPMVYVTPNLEGDNEPVGGNSGGNRGIYTT